MEAVEDIDKFHDTGDVEGVLPCIIKNENLLNSFTIENGKRPINIPVEIDNTKCVNTIMANEISGKDLYQCCYDILKKGCSNWFYEFIDYKKINGEPEENIFNAVCLAYENLIAEDVNLTNEIKCNVEIFLIDNNYRRPKWTDDLQDCYRKTKLIFLQICDELKSSLKTELFLLKLKMFLKYSSMLQLLHLRLKYNRENLCWNQIEFLISLHICIEEKRLQNNFIYMSLDKKLIISYIEVFLFDLKNSEVIKPSKEDKKSIPKVVIKKENKSNNKDSKINFTEINKISKETITEKKLIPKEIRIKVNKLKQLENKIKPKFREINKTRKELKKNYNHLKNITTIERINNKIQTALNINLNEDGVTGIYTIRRVLQIIGEGLKSTDSSRNISNAIVKNIKEMAPKFLIDITTNLRDILSHGALFRNNESLSNNELNKYQQLQDDLKKIINFLVDLLFMERCYALKVFFHKILKCKSLEKMRQLKKYFPNEENTFSEKYYSQMEHFREQWTIFCTKFIDRNDDEIDYINKIDDYLHEIEKQFGQESFDIHYSSFTDIKNLLLRKDAPQMLSYCRVYLRKIDNKDFMLNINTLNDAILSNVYKLILELRIRKTKEQDTLILENILEYLQVANSKPLKAIHDLKFNLEYIPSFEIEQKMKTMFNFALKEIENKFEIESEIQRHKNIYSGKKKLIEFITKNDVNQDNCQNLENMAISFGIDFKNIKGNYSKGDKFKAIKNIENIKSIYGKLVKDMKSYLEEPLKLKLQQNAIKAFFDSKEFKINSNNDKKWIKIILEQQQYQSNQKVVEYLVKLKNDLRKSLPLNSFDDENFVAEEYKKYKENVKLQSAVEMILFEIFQIIFEDDDKSDNDNSSMLIGRDLRNYLAHGNLMFDVFGIDPKRIIFLNAIKLVTLPEDLFLNIDNFIKVAKMNVKNIYKMRSLWIENKNKIDQENKTECKSYEEIEDPSNIAEVKIFLANYEEMGKDDLPFVYLFPAISANNLKIVTILCKRGVNLSQVHPEFKATPLFIACYFGFKDIVIEILKYGGDMRYRNNEGNNALLIALYYCHEKVVDYLLDYLLNKDNDYVNEVINNVNKNGLHIFHLAILKGSIKIIKKLIFMKQIDINMKYQNASFLYYACKQGRVSIVKTLVAENANINIKDEYDLCPLHYAVKFGCVKIIKILLKEKPNLDGLLLEAINTRNLNILKLLIKNHADINVTDEEGRNILHWSIILNSPEIAIYLIEKEYFDLSLRLETGCTYLHLAAEKTSTQVIDALIKYTKNKINFNEEDIYTITPLQCAFLYNNTAMIKYLILNGANVSLYSHLNLAITHEFYENLITLLEFGADVNQTDKDGYTPLHSAIHMGNIYTVKLLIDCGADVNVFGKYQLTPLMMSALLDSYDIVVMLLKAGAQINIKSIYEWMYSIVDNIESIQMDIVKLFIEKGIVLDTCWDVKLTTKHVNDVKNNLEIIQNVIKFETEFSPLQNAIINDDLNVVKSLSSVKEYINCANSDSNITPVMMSVVLNKLDHLKILIENGADVNCRYYNENETPLMFATVLENLEMVDVLLKADANVNAKTIYGRTSIFYAAQSYEIEIVKVLIESGAIIDKILCMSIILMDPEILKGIMNLLYEQDEP